MSSDEITVLHVDDEPDFGSLVATYLERIDDRLTVVTAMSVDGAIDRLESAAFDCVVSDYDMPGTGGLALLDFVREEFGELPFILFTGRGSEEIAGEAIAAGVTGYLQKETTTSQYEVLANRIANAVAQRRAERAVEATEQRYQRLIEESSDAICILRPDATIEYVSPAVERIAGYDHESFAGETVLEYVHPADVSLAAEALSTLTDDPAARIDVELRFRHADGHWVWLEARGRNLRADPTVEGLVVYVRDIGERKRREQQLSALFETTEGLIRSEAREAILSRAVTAADEILGLAATGFYAATDEGTLRPAAMTDRAVELFGELPAFTGGEGSLVWRAFETGEPVFAGDVEGRDERYGPDVAVGSEMVIPVGEWGVLVTAATEPDAFDETDRTLAQLLVSNVEAALERTNRETATDERCDG
ncbi:hypothetical protein BRD16_03760 [Halobacteriales archaeon SW_6_65_46]|nr:MAG: hypothetical protein BRD16_03760 [Halobacteriales archaeon SW_6_65_46]